ncbi:MAG: YidC/Oxa1 family membrane protein insertase [Clostridia bacterium]|nr:YidC/Oxa1 family membrane protein insertase [Clostridia bacterium]
MNAIFNLINKPLGWVLEFLARMVGGNFAAAVALFTLLINLLLIPLNIKSQKSSVQQLRIKPRLDELKKRYGDDKQRYNTEMQKLYQEEGVSMSGGCLPLILRMVLMISIYWLIMQPLTYLIHIQPDTIKQAAETLGIATKKSGYELQLIEALKQTDKFPEITSKLGSINFNLFGINLTETPKFSFDIFHDYQPIWLIPIFAFLAQMLTGVISMRVQKHLNPDAPSMAAMMLTMPLFSLFIGFSLPGGVGFYWICSSLIGSLLQTAVQLWYGPNKMLAKERSKELSKRCEFEAKQLKKFGEASPKDE